MTRCHFPLAIAHAVLVTGIATAAPVILNEYNAVDDDLCLEGPTPLQCGSDAYWGERLGNGNDWFELVVVQDHLDMRQWQFVVTNDTGTIGGEETFLLTLTNDPVWYDLRSGTIITVSEELRSDVDAYNPVVGRWWLNVRASATDAGTYVTVQCLSPACAPINANWKVSNKNWQITIRNQLGIVVFGPAGEGIAPASGVGSDEVCKLEADPSGLITPFSNYNDGGTSTFGSPNRWASGASVQDLSALRSVVPYTPLTSVRINECLTHSDPGTDWVELYNTTASPIDIGRWYLSDSFQSLTDFQIPADTIIPPFGYVVFHQGTNVGELPFGFSSSQGDEVVLSAADAAGIMTGERDYALLDPMENGVVLGRFPNGDGRFLRLRTATQGAPNAEPLVGPIVINEVMYHPAPPGLRYTIDPEFVELHNMSAVAVDLFSDYGPPFYVVPWAIKGGVDFQFPVNTTIPPHGFLLIVSFDPANSVLLEQFRSIYSLDASVAIVGPYVGLLSNFSDTVRLEKPDSPEVSFVPMIPVDAVTYFDFGDWPEEADGFGPSLERIVPDSIGIEPAAWMARNGYAGSPGAWNGDSIPAVSKPGLMVLLLLFIGAAAVVQHRRTRPATASQVAARRPPTNAGIRPKSRGCGKRSDAEMQP